MDFACLSLPAAYIATWNASDVAQRWPLLQAHWTEGASYADPLMAGRGQDEIDALIRRLDLKNCALVGFRWGRARSLATCRVTVMRGSTAWRCWRG